MKTSKHKYSSFDDDEFCDEVREKWFLMVNGKLDYRNVDHIFIETYIDRYEFKKWIRKVFTKLSNDINNFNMNDTTKKSETIQSEWNTLINNLLHLYMIDSVPEYDSMCENILRSIEFTNGVIKNNTKPDMLSFCSYYLISRSLEDAGMI